MLIRPSIPADYPAVADLQEAAWRIAYQDIIPARALHKRILHQRQRWEEQRLIHNPASIVMPHELGQLILTEDDGILIGRIIRNPCPCDLAIAEDHGAILGFAQYTPKADDSPQPTGKIRNLCVAPDHWRQGIGRRLVSRVQDTIAAAGCRQLMLWAVRACDRACRFYEALGFTFDGTTRPDPHAGELLRYTKPLQPGH